MIFASLESAKKIVKDLYPEAKEINYIDHGYDNLVVLVDKKFALRFPRDENAYARSRYEKLVLLELTSLTEVEIPKILGEGQDPPYLITSFVPGKHISSIDINSLPLDKQQRIAEKLAKFAYSMHSLLSVDKAREIRKKLRLDELSEEPWDIYFEKVLNKTTFPTQKQDKLAKEYYIKWKSLKFDTPTVVIHDDVHTENMLFEKGELIGILDFGDTNIGTPEQELRQLYRINEQILMFASKKYEELSGYKLNLEASKIWAITQELAVYSELLLKKKTKQSGFFRAVRNLSKWLPERNWSSGIEDNGTVTTIQ